MYDKISICIYTYLIYSRDVSLHLFFEIRITASAHGTLRGV